MEAEAEKCDEANQARELMESRGAKKTGCSWVQIDDEPHAFVSGERMVGADSGLRFADFLIHYPMFANRMCTSTTLKSIIAPFRFWM